MRAGRPGRYPRGVVFERFPPPPPRALAQLAFSAGLGALGLLPGVAGAFDPLTALGWLTLVAPAAGVLGGASGAAWFPFGACVPWVWGLGLVLLQASGGRALVSPLWPVCALVGLHGLGFALGRRARAPLCAAGLTLLAMLALTGAAVGFGLLAGGTELARAHPGLAAGLLEASPLVWVFDCAGVDWPHAQPEVYARAGIEWFQRRPHAGSLVGPVLLLAGCGLAAFSRPARPARTET